MTKVTLNSLNVRGLRDDTKRSTIFHWLKNSYKGICLLQETHSSLDVEEKWRREWNGHIEYCHGTTNSKGVAVLFPSNYDVIVVSKQTDDDGRYIVLDVCIAQERLIIINLYAPTKDKEREQILLLDKIQEIVEDNQGLPIILGGDFNTYLNPTLDKKGGHSSIQSRYALHLNSFIEEYNLVDAFRAVYPDIKRFSWRGISRTGLSQSRLDYFIISSHLMSDLVTVSINPSVKSDHSIITIKFNILKKDSKGRGFWKFNSNLLRDNNYIQIVKDTITECKDQYSYIEDKGMMWDAIKCEIRSRTISYTAWLSKLRRQEYNNLMNEIQELEENNETLSANMDEYNLKKNQVESILLEQAKGIQIRSRATHVENNEKCTKYFMQLEQKNALEKNIRMLITKDGPITTPQEVLKEQVSFYKKLYCNQSANSCMDNCSLLQENFPVISDVDKEKCDSDVTIEELGFALAELSNNKSPGSDGFTAEFYKFFWADLKLLFFEVVQYEFETGMLSTEQRRSLLTLLPKPEKDTRYLKNWRPLSLLNTDYKIIAKMLCIRLQNVIDNLVNEDQVGYIKGRQLGENCRKIVDVFEYTEHLRDPGFILFLDFEKAFDSVSRDFMYKALSKFNFGPQFINWIKLLYNQPLCIVTNNGHAGEGFVTTRGIRQGCPISALLFILVAEVMSISIRAKDNIHGLKLNNVTMKISQMADDTTIFVKDTASVKNVLDLLNHFANCAGLKLNKEKTQAIQLGEESKKISCKFGLNWDQEYVKVTGVVVGKNIKDAQSRILEEKLVKIQSLLNMWQSRKLTIKGKITLLRSKVLPTLLYVASIVYVPDDVIARVDAMFFKFIWPSGKHHVKKRVLIQQIEDGGLKMPDVASMIKALKLRWLRTLCSKETTFTCFAKTLLNIEDIHTFIRYKCDCKYLKMPHFYLQLFHFWYELHSRPPENVENILDEFIWYNKKILIAKKPIYYIQWHKKGIKRIYDIIKLNGTFYTPNELSVRYGFHIDLMMYNSIISAVPKEWKKVIRDSNLNTFIPSPEDRILVKLGNIYKDIFSISCKEFYNEFVYCKIDRASALYTWEELYYYADFDWKILFKIPYKVTRETNLQSLQYQIFHRYVPCYVNLNIWGKENSDKCPLCNDVDTMEHFFTQCTTVKALWSFLTDILQITYDVNINLKCLDILMGIPCECDFFSVVNFCILFGKKYIYDCRVNSDVVNILVFRKRLRARIEIEIMLLLELEGKQNLKSMWVALAQQLDK
jgi:exonuclease III